MKHRPEPDVLPCDQSLVVMGNSYSSPPEQWRTSESRCASCNARFVVTASEQRFWYEELRIPYAVSINRCRPCRRKQRAHRRLMARLSELMPLVDRGEADESQQRDAALTIAEGMLRRLPTHRGLDIAILSGSSIAEKGAMLVAKLRKRAKRHDDLIPLQILFHERLEHAKRLERLRSELSAVENANGPVQRSLRTVAAWLKSPTKSLRERIAEPPRR